MNPLELVFDWLLQASLRASLLSVAVLLLQRVLRQHLSARWLYALWLPVLVVLLMPALVESRWSAESLLVVAEPAPQRVTNMPLEAVPASHAPSPVMPGPTRRLDWRHVWLVGVLGLIITGLVSFTLTLRRFRRVACEPDAELLAEVTALSQELGLRRAPSVCLSSAISSPAVAGLFRPILLLPSGFREAFSAREARLVLKHELMHLKRGDLLVNALLCVLMALHWFNPLLWLAFYKARTDREAACDEDVLRHDSPNERAEYGHALLKAQSAFCPHGWSLSFVGIFERGAGLRTRIQAIAQRRRTNRGVAVAAVSFMMMLTLLGVTRAEKAVPQNEAGALIGVEITFSKISKEVSGFSDDLKSWLEGDSEAHTISNEAYEELLRHLPSTKSSYPRMVTRNTQEASIRSVVNQPVPDAKQSSGVSYLPIGIVLGITPTHRDGKVQLEIDLNDSHIIGEDKTPSGPMPITKSWAFKSTVEVPLGHSLVLWNKAERKLYTIRPTLVSGKEEGAPPKETAAEGLIAKKLKSLIFPKVQFSGATLEEALAFLRAKSRILDTSEPNEAKRGVNFLWQGGSAHEALISMDLKNVPLSEVVKYTADLAGLEYRIEENAVVFLSRSKDTAAKPATPINGKAVELAKKYILPQVQFSKATVEEAVEFLRANHRDREEAPTPWINLILKPGGNPKTQITLDLKDVSLWEAVRYIAELSNHTLSVDDHTIILTPR